MSKYIDAYPREGVLFQTEPLFQWDYGQVIRLHISNLPASYKVEFSNSTRADAIPPTVQTTNEITVPAELLESSSMIYAWIVIVDEARTTEYILAIPVIARKKPPVDEEPEPDERSEIDQVLSALNSGVERVEQIANEIPETVETALTEAKQSGMFDGPPGETGPQGEPGETGATGATGQQGEPGPKGDPFTYSDFTPEQLAALKGPKGDTGDTGETGPKGDPFTYSDFTPEQLAALKGPKGDTGDDYILTSADKAEIANQVAEGMIVYVSGTTPSISAQAGIQYICGEVATLDITLPASGCIDVLFQSGSTPTVLTVTPPSGVNVKWANGFDPTSLDANATYELNIQNGLGVAVSWA